MLNELLVADLEQVDIRAYLAPECTLSSQGREGNTQSATDILSEGRGEAHERIPVMRHTTSDDGLRALFVPEELRNLPQSYA